MAQGRLVGGVRVPSGRPLGKVKGKLPQLVRCLVLVVPGKDVGFAELDQLLLEVKEGLP